MKSRRTLLITLVSIVLVLYGLVGAATVIAQPDKASTTISAGGIIDRSDGSSSTVDIVNQVALNMGVTIDTASPTKVGDFLDTFSKLPTEDRMRCGVWGEDTNERTRQKMVLGLIPFIPEKVTAPNTIIHDDSGQGDAVRCVK